MTIRPLADKVFVIPDRPATHVGFLALPDRDVPSYSGTVAALGPGVRCAKCATRQPARIRRGQHVLYAPSSGQEFAFAGDTYIVLRQDQVLGILE